MSALPQPAPPPEALALHGLRAVARLAAPVEALERLDALARATPQGASAVRLTPEVLAGLGWAPGQAKRILRALGFVPARKAGVGGSNLWRRRLRSTEAALIGPAASPFAAALAGLGAPLAAPARRARRNRARRRGAS